MCISNSIITSGLYFQAMAFAKAFITSGGYYVEAGDVVHDILVESTLAENGFQKQIARKVINYSSIIKFIPIELAAQYQRVYRLKGDVEDFVCTKCNQVLPGAFKKGWHNDLGVYQTRNTCTECTKTAYVERTDEEKAKRKIYDREHADSVNAARREKYKNDAELRQKTRDRVARNSKKKK